MWCTAKERYDEFTFLSDGAKIFHEEKGTNPNFFSIKHFSLNDKR